MDDASEKLIESNGTFNVFENQGWQWMEGFYQHFAQGHSKSFVTKVVITNQFQELWSLKVKIYEDGPTELTSGEVN